MSKKTNKSKSMKKIFTILGMILLAILISIIVSTCIVKSGRFQLNTYWTRGSSVSKNIKDYVSKVTNPNDKVNFIPEKDRIAVFDMDGTLMCETYFTYVLVYSKSGVY